MKELNGTASAEVSAPIDRCFELLVALDGYPRWYPEVVRNVEVLNRAEDGRPERARTTLHAELGPIQRDFHLLMEVEARPPALIRLARVPHEPDDPERFEVTWTLTQGARTVIALTLDANLAMPRLVPVGGIGESFARGFVAAARRELG